MSVTELSAQQVYTLYAIGAFALIAPLAFIVAAVAGTLSRQYAAERQPLSSAVSPTWTETRPALAFD